MASSLWHRYVVRGLVPPAAFSETRAYADATLLGKQTFGAVYLYSTLVSDRAALQAEVMHEYNTKFVHPRVFVPKRDACVSTSEAEMVSARDWRAPPVHQHQHHSTSTSSPRKSGVAGRWSSSTPVRGRREIREIEADVDEASEEGELEEQDEEEEEQVVQRGSGRKVRRRQSEMPLRRAVLEEQQQQQQQRQSDDSGSTGSPVPARRRQARASMFG